MGRQPRGRQNAQAGKLSKEGLLPSRPTTRVPTWTTGTLKKALPCQMGTQSTPQVSAGLGASSLLLAELQWGWKKPSSGEFPSLSWDLGRVGQGCRVQNPEAVQWGFW